jgi:hypothetical protein
MRKEAERVCSVAGTAAKGSSPAIAAALVPPSRRFRAVNLAGQYADVSVLLGERLFSGAKSKNDGAMVGFS